MFIREIGDAVLFVFAHFPDILRWHDSLSAYLRIFNEDAWKDHPLRIRTLIHVGEVHLNGVTPISLAVFQLFKVEKSAGVDEIVLTEPAFTVAWPSIARAYHAFDPSGETDVEGYRGRLKLYRLKITECSSPSRIADETHE